MYKTYFLIQPGLDDPFRWRGDAAADAARARFPGLVGYYQTRAVPDQEAPAFSGIAELWFEHPAAALKAQSQGPGDLLAAGVTLQSSMAGMERVVVRTPRYIHGERIKCVYPFCKRDDMTVAAFQSRWWHGHGPIAALTEEALSYIQIHPLAESYDKHPPFYDGITEISWPDMAAAARGIGSRQMKEDQGSDAPHFVNLDTVSLFFAHEEIVIEP